MRDTGTGFTAASSSLASSPPASLLPSSPVRVPLSVVCRHDRQHSEREHSGFRGERERGTRYADTHADGRKEMEVEFMCAIMQGFLPREAKRRKVLAFIIAFTIFIRMKESEKESEAERKG